MKPIDALRRLLSEWQELSQVEHAAICESNWQALASAQRQKEGLRANILETTDSWRLEVGSSAAWRSEFERELRPLVNELTRQEAANQHLLGLQQRGLEQAITRNELSSRTLSGVRRVYGSRGSGSWQSYS